MPVGMCKRAQGRGGLARGGFRARGSWLAVAACLAVPAGPLAAASNTHAVQVSATILSQSVCRFTNNGPSLLAFGSIDPSSAGPQVVSVTTTFRCTGSAAVATYSISSDDGQNPAGPGQPRMAHGSSPGQFLPYTLNLPQTGSVPKNTVQTLTVTGTMTSTQYANAAAGTYSDSVVLTIAP
jgi:hypothetical protein